jgi:hypothetical protein
VKPELWGVPLAWRPPHVVTTHPDIPCATLNLDLFGLVHLIVSLELELIVTMALVKPMYWSVLPFSGCRSWWYGLCLDSGAQGLATSVDRGRSLGI